MLTEQIELLRHSASMVKARRPFEIDAWVVMPEHMHCIWTLPDGDTDFSSRWRDIKIALSRGLPRLEKRNPVMQRRGERGIWQHRFWEHAIRDMDDYKRHVDYVHRNPVKHGFVASVRDWPYSTFHRFLAQGIYREDWLGDDSEILTGERE